MKMCIPHWEELKKAVEDRRMGHLISKSGEELFEGIKEQIDGNPTAPYDPLMDACMMIYSAGLEAGGLYLMGAKEDGTEYCPLCELKEHGGDPQEWINGCTDAILKQCKEKGLVQDVH